MIRTTNYIFFESKEDWDRNYWTPEWRTIEDDDNYIRYYDDILDKEFLFLIFNKNYPKTFPALFKIICNVYGGDVIQELLPVNFELHQQNFTQEIVFSLQIYDEDIFKIQYQQKKLKEHLKILDIKKYLCYNIEKQSEV